MTNQIMVKMALDAWNSQIKNGDDLLEKLSDEQLMTEVAPGRNRGIYLVGHLVAVHDRMLPLLGLGEQLYPQLNEPFLKNPDNAKAAMPSVKELRQFWKNINSTLADHFSKMQSDAWFQKHTSVSAEDFAKEPHRNKLNTILSRTSHLSNHLGQLVFLKK
ncbi:MAG: DinB family protein [Bacteroidetes bacterium]|nr:DinB family protein [Bacteroidota bacterium]